MPNFWINADGNNTLKGEYNNPCNPLALPDNLIIEFLHLYADARKGLIELIDSMNPCEQDRLNNIISLHPNMFFPQPYEQDYEDLIQKKRNCLVVRQVNTGSPKGTKPTGENSGLALRTFRSY